MGLAARPKSWVTLPGRSALLLALALTASATLRAEPLSTWAELAREEPGRYVWSLPPGFPEPAVPPDNPMSQAKVELGRHLFFDPRLSFDGRLSCASCHRPSLAFSDGRPRAVARGALHRHGAPSLANVSYSPSLGWERRGIHSLEAQMREPLFGVEPVELGLSGREPVVLARLASAPRYAALFAAAFSGDPNPIELDNVVRAIASFERTLVSGSSPYDRWLFRDEREALEEDARRGMRLFFGSRLRCGACHGGLLLSGALRTRDGDGPPARFARVADLEARVPSLRNVAATAPYMHDGRFDSLKEVISHYSSGPDPDDPRLVGFEIEPQERRAVVAFLQSLSDPSFGTHPAHANPWAPQP